MAPRDPRRATSNADPISALLARVVRARGQLTVLTADLPDAHGMTERDLGIIVLDRSCTDPEMRCTLAHELGHLDDPEADCDEIEARAAALLVPAQEAAIVVAGADPQMVAAALGVDAQMVRARVRSITAEAADGVG